LFTPYHLDISRIGVSMEEVFDLFHETDRSADNPVVSEVAEIYRQLPEICDIRGGYIIFDGAEVSASEGIIHLNGGKYITPQKKVCGYMKNATGIAVFTCTAGKNFTDLAKKYQVEGDYLKNYIVDTFGSLVVEKAMDYIQGEMELQIGKSVGLQITNRYSPGYCNWPLTGQRQLFDLLGEQQRYVSLTDSMLMIPIKSVSGIIGIGKNVKKNKYACQVCGDKSCIYRDILQRSRA
jgi:hypothetical protein